MTHVLCKAKVLGKGYALADVVTCIVELVDLALPAAAFAPLMVALADIKYIEHRRAVSIREISKFKFRVLCAYFCGSIAFAGGARPTVVGLIFEVFIIFIKLGCKHDGNNSR